MALGVDGIPVVVDGTTTPHLIMVFIGGNDVLLTPRLDGARFADEFDQLVEPFADPSVTVVLSTLPELAA